MKVALTFAFMLVTSCYGSLLRDNIPENVRDQLEISKRHQFGLTIIGGDEVDPPHSIPIQVSLQYKTINFHFCGGSVGTENFVITAAHCCVDQNADQIKVVAGDHNIKLDEGTEQIRNIKTIKMHPDYLHKTMENDICLLELDEPLTFNEYVSGVNLPDQNQLFEGTGTVSGWGTLDYDDTVFPDTLQAVDVPIVPEQVCKDALGKHNVKESMLCAGEEGKDSCQGDSGGPLMKSGTTEQVGIISTGYGCNDNIPAIYTNVGLYHQWIYQQIKNQHNQSIVTTTEHIVKNTAINTTQYMHDNDNMDDQNLQLSVGCSVAGLVLLCCFAMLYGIKTMRNKKLQKTKYGIMREEISGKVDKEKKIKKQNKTKKTNEIEGTLNVNITSQIELNPTNKDTLFK